MVWDRITEYISPLRFFLFCKSDSLCPYVYPFNPTLPSNIELPHTTRNICFHRLGPNLCSAKNALPPPLNYSELTNRSNFKFKSSSAHYVFISYDYTFFTVFAFWKRAPARAVFLCKCVRVFFSCFLSGWLGENFTNVLCKCDTLLRCAPTSSFRYGQCQRQLLGVLITRWDYGFLPTNMQTFNLCHII